jgi:uncharacterized metal-binding protein YceD (DUF177 family)
MTARETIEEIILTERDIDDEMAEELKLMIASDIDEYLEEETFLELPIKWLIDITKKEDVTDDQAIILIKKNDRKRKRRSSSSY